MKRTKVVDKYLKTEDHIDYNVLCLDISKCIKNNKLDQAKELINNYNLSYSTYLSYSGEIYDLESISVFKEYHSIIKKLEKCILRDYKVIKVVPLQIATMAFLCVFMIKFSGSTFQESIYVSFICFIIFFIISMPLISLILLPNIIKIKKAIKALNQKRINTSPDK